MKSYMVPLHLREPVPLNLATHTKSVMDGQVGQILDFVVNCAFKCFEIMQNQKKPSVYFLPDITQSFFVAASYEVTWYSLWNSISPWFIIPLDDNWSTCFKSCSVLHTGCKHWAHLSRHILKPWRLSDAREDSRCVLMFHPLLTQTLVFPGAPDTTQWCRKTPNINKNREQRGWSDGSVWN